MGAWFAAAGHDVHYLTVKKQPEVVTAAKGTTLHRLHGVSRPGLRDAVAALELDALLLNPERSRRYRGIEANVLRSAYGTEHYRQKLKSFRGPSSAGSGNFGARPPGFSPSSGGSGRSMSKPPHLLMWWPSPATCVIRSWRATGSRRTTST